MTKPAVFSDRNSFTGSAYLWPWDNLFWGLENVSKSWLISVQLYNFVHSERICSARFFLSFWMLIYATDRQTDTQTNMDKQRQISRTKYWSNPAPITLNINILVNIIWIFRFFTFDILQFMQHGGDDVTCTPRIRQPVLANQKEKAVTWKCLNVGVRYSVRWTHGQFKPNVWCPFLVRRSHSDGMYYWDLLDSLVTFNKIVLFNERNSVIDVRQ